jgi:hypothetical protein
VLWQAVSAMGPACDDTLCIGITMLLGSKEKLADAIMRLFERRSEWTALELQEAIAAYNHSYTLRAVYKELHKLQQYGVVVKVKDTFSLSATWILELLDYAERIYSRHLGGVAMKHVLPDVGQKFRWRFSNLSRMDAFWLQVMFSLFENSSKKVAFSWSPRFWFPLVNYAKEQQAMRAMRIAGNKLYMIIGGESYLDRIGSQYWTRDVYEWSFTESPFESEHYKYICVIDDFLFTVKYDKATMDRIDLLFDKVDSREDINPAEVYSVFSSPCKVMIQIEQSRRKVQPIKRKFGDYFGISLKEM